MDQRQLAIVLKLQDEATKELRKFSDGLTVAEKNTSRWGSALSYVATAAKAAGVALGSALIAGGTIGIKVAAQLETAEVGLKTLLGSAEEAAKTVERLKVEAARTPFELPGLTQATQLLTSVTKDGDKSIDILLDIGEALAAMGKGQAELDRIIVNLQQVGAIGYASMIDIKQFAFAGIPIFEMLKTETGLAGEELAQFISDGKVSFEMLTQMFDKANDAGGRFAGAYADASGTFNQAMSNMKDSFSIFFADVVKQTGLFQGLTNAMIETSNWMLNYKANIDGIKSTLYEWVSLLEQKTGLISLMKDAWSSIVATFNEELRPALIELWETLKPYKPYFEALLQIIGALVAGGFAALVIMVQALIQALILLLSWITKVVNVIATVFRTELDLLRSAIDKIIGPLASFIDKLKTAWDWARKVGNAVSSFFSGGVVSSTVSAITGKASGGPVSGGTPYIVGERGPELFVPRTGGTIVPNGAGGMTVNVTVNGDVSGSELVNKVQEAIMSTLRMNTRIAL